MRDELKDLLAQIKQLIEAADSFALKTELGEQRSSDIAEIVEVLDADQMRVIFNLLDKPTAAEVLEKIDEASRDELFEILTEEEIKAIFVELDADDAADLITEIPDELRNKVLSSLERNEAFKVRQLLMYSEDSAGGIMDPLVISVDEDATIAEAVNKIRQAEIDEDFYSIFVVDEAGKFVGDVRIRHLLTRPEDTRVKDVVDPETIYVLDQADQEEVRNVFSKNDLIVVPVLDQDHKLIGRITADRVIEVAEEEAAEDLYAMAGTDADELDRFSAAHAARIRMTWLLPCLIGTGITALVLILFGRQFDLANLAIVYTTAVAFVPMIGAISGNAGLQTSAIVVSGLATGHLAALKLSQVFGREVRIALLVALCCGIIGGGVCGVLLNYKAAAEDFSIIFLVISFALAMFSAIMVSTTLGLFLPFLFRRVGIDPAISSGPLVTTANDSISAAIFMTLTLLLVS